MFFIFGWNRPEVTSYGQVLQHTCQNCKNTEFWQLNKVQRYFTLFFIPIFPHSTDYWYFCPVCSHGVTLDSGTFQHYKTIADINKAFLENRITDEERVARTEEVIKLIGQADDDSKVKYLKESEDFRDAVAAKTDDELRAIMSGDTSGYNPAFIMAVEQEMKQRRL